MTWVRRAKSIQNANELVDNEKVVAMLGGVNSGNMLAWLHIVQQKKVPTISPSATATEITNRYSEEPANYIFRVSMRDLDQITLLAAYAARRFKNKKIAIIADTTGYGQQGAKDAAHVLGLYGITPVANEKFGPKDTDMSSQLNKIKAAGADTVIVYALADANGHLMRSQRRSTTSGHAGFLGQSQPSVPAHRGAGTGQENDLHGVHHRRFHAAVARALRRDHEKGRQAAHLRVRGACL